MFNCIKPGNKLPQIAPFYHPASVLRKLAIFGKKLWMICFRKMAIVQSLRDTNDRDGETCTSSQQIATDRSYVRPATL